MQLAPEPSGSVPSDLCPVVGVLGGRGGVGASLLAAVLAAVAARRGASGRSLLVDLEAVAGGIDVLLGVEGVPGPRWSGLRLEGGHLQPSLLAEGLPRWGGVGVLAADVLPSAEAVSQLLEAGVQVGPVVVDLGRWPSPGRRAALAACSLVVVLTRSDVASVAAARTGVIGLIREGSVAPVGAVVRRSRLGADPDQVATLMGADLVGKLGASDGVDPDEPVDAYELPRGMLRVSRGIWDGLIGSGHG